MVDTRHFDDAFKLRLLACYPDIDEALDGVLVHAENYAALRTLEYRYRGRVKCIYIDPPYNTGSDDFLYKDDFSRAFDVVGDDGGTASARAVVAWRGWLDLRQH